MLSVLCERRIEPDWQEPVDVVIPVIEKDLKTLGLCIEGVRNCIKNPIAAIYIVGPDKESIRSAASELGATWIDETEVMGYGAEELNLITADGTNRSGWLYQQLIKLSGRVGNSRYYLTIDADHILLRPHPLVDRRGRTVFYRSREYHAPYYENLKRLIKKEHVEGLSYVAHKMLFDRRKVLELQRFIESNSATTARWDKAIANSVDRSTRSGFSEFETYGHFVGKDGKISLPWRQKTLRAKAGAQSYKQLKRQYGGWYRSVTYPDYLQ